MKTTAVKNRKRKGFIFIMVLIMITLIGSYIAILTGISNNLAADTNIAYLNACKKNMTRSAIAFSRQNQDAPANQPTELNISEMGKSCKSLTITKKPQPESTLQITGLCQVARQKVTIKETFRIIN